MTKEKNNADNLAKIKSGDARRYISMFLWGDAQKVAADAIQIAENRARDVAMNAFCVGHCEHKGGRCTNSETCPSRRKFIEEISK